MTIVYFHGFYVLIHPKMSVLKVESWTLFTVSAGFHTSSRIGGNFYTLYIIHKPIDFPIDFSRLVIWSLA